MKKIFITGGAGFIGSHLTEFLLKQGHYVTVIDNLSLGKKDFLPMHHAHFCFIEADLVAQYEDVVAALQGQTFDEIWHLAANSDIPAGVNNFDVDVKDTFLTTHSILKIAKMLQAKRFLFASTSAVYGDKGDAVLFEAMGDLRPISNYGAMKLAAEAQISAACENFLTEAFIFRFPNVVGPRATHGIMYDLLNKLKKKPAELEVLGDGTQQKQYLHVSELILAMNYIAEHAIEKLNCFNVGVSQSSTFVREIVEMTVLASQLKPSLHYTGGRSGWVGDVPRFTFSTEKLNALGWKPQLSSNEAVKKASLEIAKELGFIS